MDAVCELCSVKVRNVQNRILGASVGVSLIYSVQQLICLFRGQNLSLPSINSGAQMHRDRCPNRLSRIARRAQD